MPTSRLLFGLLPWYSVLITAGILLALLLCRLEERRLQLPRDTTLDLALALIPLGILGARLYYVIFSWEHYAANPISALFIWEGGLAIYGGVLGGLLGAWLLARRRKLPFMVLLDMASPGLALGQAIGRWGNFFNMEAYGVQVTRPEWQFFPFAVQIGSAWHLATFFYESLFDFAIFLFLWLTRRRRTKPGATFRCYLVLYGAVRIVVEGLRTDSLMAGPLRVSQLLSLLMCLSVCLWCAWHTEPKRRLGLLLPAAGLALLLLTAGASLPAATAGCAGFGVLCILSCGLMKAKGAG